MLVSFSIKVNFATMDLICGVQLPNLMIEWSKVISGFGPIKGDLDFRT